MLGLMNSWAGDLAVGRPGRGEVRDPRLLRRQVRGVLRRPGPGVLARRAQFRRRPLGEPFRPHPREHVMRGAQLRPGVAAPFGLTEPLAVQQVSACPVGRHLAAR